MIRMAVALVFWAAAASAQSLPGLFDIGGVATNDVLNIRAQPLATSDIIGSFAFDRTNVEVIALSADRKWGMVGTGEGNGWVAMAYLTAQPTETIPSDFRCFGTEPFWSLNVAPQSAAFSNIGEPAAPMSLLSRIGDRPGQMFVFQSAPDTMRTLIVSPSQCNDGMSDREFGWQALVFSQDTANSSVLSGCCTMDTGQ